MASGSRRIAQPRNRRLDRGQKNGCFRRRAAIHTARTIGPNLPDCVEEVGFLVDHGSGWHGGREARASHAASIGSGAGISLGVRFGDLSGEVARAFVDRAEHLAGWIVGTAVRLEWAWLAVAHACPVADQIVSRHAGSRRDERSAIVLEKLSCRAEVGVAGVVVGEVLTREGAVSALGLVEHR